MNIAINSRPIAGNFKHGIVNYTERLIYGLAEIDNVNDYTLLFTSIRKRAYQMPGPNKANFKKRVITIPDRESGLRNFILDNYLLPHFLNSKKYDIYHTPTGYTFPTTKRVKKIITVHDLRTIKISDNVFPQDIRSLQCTLLQADACITVSESTKKDILEHFRISSEKVKVVYLGVDERFKPLVNQEEVSAINKKYGLTKKYFFSVGGVPRKNIERLIKAFSIFKYRDDFQLVIGGERIDGPWGIKFKELITELRMDHSIKLIGYISDNDLPLLYSASECFLFPSLYEGFGIPLLEAMKSGVPIITSNVSSLPEIAADAALCVNPYDEKEIALAMEKIIDNDGLKQTLVKNGFKRAEEFTWEKMAKETLKIYQSLT